MNFFKQQPSKVSIKYHNKLVELKWTTRVIGMHTFNPAIRRLKLFLYAGREMPMKPFNTMDSYIFKREWTMVQSQYEFWQFYVKDNLLLIFSNAGVQLELSEIQCDRGMFCSCDIDTGLLT